MPRSSTRTSDRPVMTDTTDDPDADAAVDEPAGGLDNDVVEAADGGAADPGIDDPGIDDPGIEDTAVEFDGEPADFTPEMIDALVAERDEFLDAYRRTAADFENFRKLAQKRLADEVARSQGSFVERLLPVLDAIDAARVQGSEHVEAVAGPLFGFLEKEGLSRVHPTDEPFDPNVADAVVHEPGDDDSAGPVVSEVLRTGYLWQGRVIRPAMVKVSG